MLEELIAKFSFPAISTTAWLLAGIVVFAVIIWRQFNGFANRHDFRRMFGIKAPKNREEIAAVQPVVDAKLRELAMRQLDTRRGLSRPTELELRLQANGRKKLAAKAKERRQEAAQLAQREYEAAVEIARRFGCSTKKEFVEYILDTG